MTEAEVLEFSKVGLIESPGVYYLAEDPLEGRTHVYGHRPRFEFNMGFELRDRQPWLKKIQLFREEIGKSEKWRTMYWDWNLKDGLVYDPSTRGHFEYFTSFTKGSLPSDLNGCFQIVDRGAPLSYEDGEWKFKKTRRDGDLHVQTSSQGVTVGDHGEWWQGRVNLKGEHLGQGVRTALRYVNGWIASDSRIKVWKKTDEISGNNP